MIYLTGKIVSFLLAPGTLLLLSLLAGTTLLWSRRRFRAGRIMLSAVGLILLAVTVLPLDEMISAPLENRFPANPPLPAHVDGIIVLGGAIDPYLSIAHQQVALNDSAERLLEGARLARLHPEARLLFTGGATDPSQPEAREAPLAALVFTDLGIEPGRLAIEADSRNTYENAVFSQRLMQPRKGEVWVLVTSAKHMPRSVGVFRRIGWPVIPWPVNFVTGALPHWVNTDRLLTRLTRISSGLHEWAGLLFYRLSGWTDELFPKP